MNLTQFNKKAMSKLFTPVRSYCCRPPTYKGKLNLYSAFGKHLLFTNTWTSGVLMTIGDLCEQEIEFRKKLIPARYDWGRVGRMFLTGLMYGPLHHYFYTYMDKMIPDRHMKAIGQKIFLDQTVMSPSCILLLFYSVGIMEGKTLRAIGQDLRAKFLDIYMVDWCTWVPSQFINFYFLPVKYQVVYVNCVTMVYNVFLSYMKHKNIEEVKDV